MRVLQLVKASDGARWAAWQTRVLTQLGIQVNVVLPSARGEALTLWQQSGARLHFADLSLPLRQPWRWVMVRRKLNDLVDQVSPDLIHSHFVTNMLALRLALGREHPIPRIFQVPGPLHLESPLTRWLDLKTFGSHDHWIASSRYTRDLYRRFNAPRERLYLSYYSTPLDRVSFTRTGKLRERLGIPSTDHVVGNISYIYPPKYFLGHTIGIKGHEYVIDALAQVSKKRGDVTGVLVGGQWPGGSAYRERLMRRAHRQAGCRIRFAERVGFQAVNTLWADFDCAVHLPVSENCGGVIEPLAALVPTVASCTGGLPEVIINGVTGWAVPPRNADAAADAILEALADREEAQRRTQTGKQLVLEMFDPERTGHEVAQIYQHILDEKFSAPSDFDSARLARHSQLATECKSGMTPSFYRAHGKRWLDLALAIPALVLLSPLFPLLALLVRIQLGAPVLFRQTRAGQDGKPFQILKFRTMTDARDEDGNLRADAERLTRFGRALRSTSLDELPELINVLRGEMSVVGPRPLFMEYLPRYTQEQRQRHQVLPGITGWVQVNGRNALTWEQKFALDVWYVKHQSLGLDLKILAMTMRTLLQREGISEPGHATVEEFRSVHQ